ncbi:MAG: hypothetical protein KAG66_03125 [Methylococcales bacterium]|jgi:hypothetical protein|nr:hypothetical protein [Methylococcales bacterium]
MGKRVYNLYADGSHGWLRVPLAELWDLKIEETISAYSYRKGKWAYLEEDRDAPLFLRADKDRADRMKYAPARVKEIPPVERSSIRSYAGYYPAWWSD